jgi:hypothetical protein
MAGEWFWRDEPELEALASLGLMVADAFQLERWLEPASGDEEEDWAEMGPRGF